MGSALHILLARRAATGRPRRCNPRTLEPLAVHEGATLITPSAVCTTRTVTLLLFFVPSLPVTVPATAICRKKVPHSSLARSMYFQPHSALLHPHTLCDNSATHPSPGRCRNSAANHGCVACRTLPTAGVIGVRGDDRCLGKGEPGRESGGGW